MTDDPEEPVEESEPEQPAKGKKAKKVKVPKPPKPPKPPKAPKTPKDKTAKAKGFNWVLVLVPVAVMAGLVLAFTLPPTHTMLVNGPLKPLFARFGLAPTALAARPAKSADPVDEVKRLNETLQSDRAKAVAKDAQIAQLHAQVTELQAQPKSTPAPAPTAKPSPIAVSDEVKRTATYWAGMDADKAAEIVKLLPDPYVKLVFSQMPADSVADIVSALPAKTGARLTASAGGN